MSTNLVELTIPQPAPITDGSQMVERIQAMTVTDAVSYENVAEIRAAARNRWKYWDEQRAEMKAPSLRAGEKVDDFFRPVLVALKKAGDIADEKLRAFDTEQRLIAQKKQREAEEEAARVRKKAEDDARAERENAQMALSEITGIQHQVIIAQAGRLGVRKGGTVECIEETLAETERWPITEENFGKFFEAAKKAKENSITAIKALRDAFVSRQQAAASEQSASDARKSALESRKAELRAEEARQKQEQETAMLRKESEQRVRDLEYVAATTVAEEVKPNVVEVAGMSRPKVWKWRLLDKRKLKDDFTIVDEKAINKLVIGMQARAHNVVGIGAIEIYQEEQLRQR